MFIFTPSASLVPLIQEDNINTIFFSYSSSAFRGGGRRPEGFNRCYIFCFSRPPNTGGQYKYHFLLIFLPCFRGGGRRPEGFNRCYIFYFARPPNTGEQYKYLFLLIFLPCFRGGGRRPEGLNHYLIFRFIVVSTGEIYIIANFI